MGSKWEKPRPGITAMCVVFSMEILGLLCSFGG